MKITSIMGSPHGVKGTAGPIVNRMMEAVQDGVAEAEIISLANYNIQPCKGCRMCAKTGRCVIKDDYTGIKERLLEADGIILVSPNYMHNVSAQMKAFLDRSFSLCHCQTLKGKYGAVVVTSGGLKFETPENYLLEVLVLMGCWSVGTLCAAELQLADKEERARITREAYNLGNRMVKAVGSREVFPDQEQDLKQIFEEAKMLVEVFKDEWVFEYEYWKSRWGLEEQ
jgi:multimeric flavodoxin WrbA